MLLTILAYAILVLVAEAILFITCVLMGDGDLTGSAWVWAFVNVLMGIVLSVVWALNYLGIEG